jgi:hypothetical protein
MRYLHDNALVQMFVQGFGNPLTQFWDDGWGWYNNHHQVSTTTGGGGGC